MLGESSASIPAQRNLPVSPRRLIQLDFEHGANLPIIREARRADMLAQRLAEELQEAERTPVAQIH